MTITEIKQRNKAAGQNYFSRATMRYFNSIVYRTVYGGRYFVTSEQMDSELNGTRKFTVRRAEDDGGIKTVGEFQQYRTQEDARVAAILAANAEGAMFKAK